MNLVISAVNYFHGRWEKSFFFGFHKGFLRNLLKIKGLGVVNY